MSKLNCIIVEDEPLARKILEGYISRVPFLQLQGSFEDAIDAMGHLNNYSVDLMFLDLHLPEIKGFAFLKTLSSPPAVIITTAYHQYAVEGFELNVVDYLLKPFEFDRFLTAVSKVADKRNSKRQPSNVVKDYFFVSIQLKKVKILFSEILYVESQKEYVKIVTASQTFTTRMSTHEIESLLPPAIFKRVHRSFIVSLPKIQSFNAEMVEVNGVNIPVSRGYKDVLDML